MAGLGARRDPYLGFRFLVELESIVVGGFTEVTGLSGEIETFPYREGGRNAYQHQLPGPVTYPRLVFKHGISDSPTLWTWAEDARRGRIKRRNGSILLGDELRPDAWRWDFVDAYPVKWTGPELRSEPAAVALESIELVHRGIKLHGATPSGLRP